VDDRQRQSVQFREPERGVVNALAVPLTRRTTSSDHNCSSPTIDEQQRGVTKADVCRCHGTYEHGIFRRDTTPEYTEGDRRRPPSPVPKPITYRRKNLKAEPRFINDEPKSVDNGDKQGVKHVAARSFQESSTERQHNQPGGQSSSPDGNRDVKDSKSRNYEATSVKKQGDFSLPSSSDDSSDEKAGRDQGRKRDDDHHRGRRDGHRHSRSRRSSSRSSSPRRHHSSSVSQKCWLKQIRWAFQF